MADQDPRLEESEPIDSGPLFDEETVRAADELMALLDADEFGGT